MDNYKIKVNDEAESKEAQELFEQLGYSNGQSKRFGFVYTQNGEIGCDSMEHWDYYNDLCQELTLPQLRDLVVLKRGDIADASHYQTIEPDSKFFVTSNDSVFFFDDDDAWVRSGIRLSELTPIKPSQDPALISGAEAHQALLAGENVQYSGYGEQYWDTALNCNIGVFLNHEKFPDFKFRIVPRTIKLELELPKPFEPKEGDIYWFLSPFYSTGYDHCTFANDSSDKLHVQYGAYRSEDDVKKAVEQLRKIRGAS